MNLKNKIYLIIFTYVLFIAFIKIQVSEALLYITIATNVFIAIIAYEIYQSYNSKYNTIIQKLEELVDGNYTLLKDDNTPFIKLINKITKTLSDVSLISYGISKNDLSIKSKLKEEDNLLAKALNKMLFNLKNKSEINDSEKWIKDEILKLNELLIDDKSVDDISNIVIEFIAKSINAFTGMIYIYEKKEKVLNLSASYAFYPSRTPITYKIGEGTIGEVANSKKYIIHNNIINSYDENPDSITAKAKIYTFTYPLSYQGKLHAVIELASYKELVDFELEFLLQSELLISTAIASSRSKENVQNLLENTQVLNNEMIQREEAQNAHSIVGVTDIKGTIIYANNKFSEISGYSNDELIGSNHRIVNSSEYDTEFWTNMYDTVSSGKIWHYPAVKNKAKSGEFYWVDTTIYPMIGKNGKAESYIAIRTNVTQSVLNINEMAQAKQKAELAAKAKTEFLASMSHEIRTPINGVIGMLGLLKHTNLSKQQYEYSRLAESSAESLLSVINDILDFSKIEADKIILEEIEFDILEELSNFSKSISINISSLEVELILDTLKINKCTIIADLGRLKQILNNIVGNAVKFTHHGHILIKADIRQEKDETLLYIDVSDTGIGISEDKIETLFQAFTQADSSTTRKYGGTGLGLSIARKLTELMGGKIKVNSVLGEGTTFSFCINIKKVTSKKLIMPPMDIKGKNILIVDDNIINIEILEKQLQIWEINVISALSALEALQILKNQSFDIMISDMGMPNMNGEDLAKKVKKIPSCKNMKIILMTSYGQYDTMKSLNKIGFHAFFSKPTTQSDLLNAINIISKDNYKHSKIITKEKIGTFSKVKNIWKENTKILMIEDNITNQLVAQGILEHYGLKADIVNNGQEAIDKLLISSHTYDLLLMDCQMPILDGFETTIQIREAKAGIKHKDVTIIAMTANAMDGDRNKCLSVGMNDYISKPINPSILNDMLIKYLEQDISNINEEIDKDLWDKESALARVMNKEKHFVKIINSFVNENEQNLIELEKSIITKDFTSIQKVSHTIKGSASNINATNLSQLASEIEVLSKENNLEKINEKLNEIQSQSILLNNILKEYLKGK